MKNHPVDNIFSKGLTDYSVSPSAEAKKKLFATPEALKPIKPWYISYKYLLIATPAILFISVLTFLYFNQNSTKITDSTLNNKTLVNENNNNINPVDEKNTSNNVTNNNNFSEYKKQEKIETPAQVDKIKNNEVAKADNHNNPISNEKFVDNDNIIYENKMTDKNNHINSKTETNFNNVSESTNNLSNPTSKEYHNESVYNSETISSINIEKNSTTATDDKTFIKYLDPLYQNNIENNLDDFSFNTKKETDYHLNGFWFIEFKIGSFGSNHKVISNGTEWKNAAEAKQKLLSYSPGNDFQINTIYVRNNLIFKAGLSYVNYGEKLSGNVLLTDPKNQINISFNNNAPYDIILGGNYYNIDTLGGYYHYIYTQTDHIYVSDSSWVWNTQNTPADVYDTTQYTIFDTLPENFNYNNIRFLELPISIGFAKPYGKFSVGISATASPGLFLAVKGSNMSIESYPALEPYQKSNMQKFIFSAGLNLEIGYQINDKLMLSFEPFYKKSLSKLYKTSNNINQTFDSYGFRLGIRKLL